MSLVKDLDHALDILGLSRGATREAITARYRELAKQYHPDLYHGEDIPEELREHATEKIKAINEAYRIALAAQPALEGGPLPRSDVEIAWKFQTTYQVFGPPVIVDGTIYFCTRGRMFWDEDGSLHAVDLKTGQERWRFRTGAKATASVSVVDGVAYFGSTDCHLYAIDVNTPEEMWRTKTEIPVKRTPVVAEGLVFSQHFVENALSALDVKTGKPKWTFKAAGDVAYSPAIADSHAYFSTGDGYVYSLDIKTQKMKWRAKFRDYPIFEPVVCDDLVLFYFSNNRIIALDRETAQERWELPSGPSQGSWTDGLGKGDGMIFVPGDRTTYQNAQILRHLYALDPASGEVQWESPANSERFHTPVFHEGIVYVTNVFSPVAAFHAKTGDKLWDFDLQKWTYRLTAHQGMVYVGTVDGLYALKPTAPLSEEQPKPKAEKEVRMIPQKKKRIRRK